MSKLESLQKQYDEMKAIALDAIANDIELDGMFEEELYAMLKVVKSLGGKA